MYDKTKIFNLALGALLLQKELTNADSDTSKEARILRTHWEPAFFAALAELDLDSTMSTVTLELLATDPNDLWAFVYKYPSTCAFMRRIVSAVTKDDDSTAIKKNTGVYSGKKAIFTNEQYAMIEMIPKDVPLISLNAEAGLAVAYKLAYLSAPFFVGKGARLIRDQINHEFLTNKLLAQANDKSENHNFESAALQSPFVRARLE